MKTRFTHILSTGLFTALIFLGNAVNGNSIRGGGDKNDGFIDWNSGNKLTWNNFKAEASEEDKGFAFAYTDIDCFYSINDGLIHYQVSAVFYEDESWVKDDARNPVTLFWQQLNFDLTAQFAYKLSDALSNHNFAAKDEEKFNKTVSKIKYDWQMTQLDFFAEMNHYTNDFKHVKKWASKVGYNPKELKANLFPEVADVE